MFIGTYSFYMLNIISFQARKLTENLGRAEIDSIYVYIWIFSLYRVQRKLKGRPWLLEEYAAFDRLNDFYYKNHKINVFKHKINVSKHKINVFQAIHNFQNYWRYMIKPKLLEIHNKTKIVLVSNFFAWKVHKMMTQKPYNLFDKHIFI